MVVTGGPTGRRHGDGWRRQAAAATMLDCSRVFFFNCSAMRLWDIRMWREVRVSFVKLS